MTDPLEIIRPHRGPIDLEGIWAPNPAFLVCSGPSLYDLPLDRLREKGVASLGVNNAAAVAPVKAWCFSDPQAKFHHGLHLDPAVMTFAPVPKLRYGVALKDDEGWHHTGIKVRDCPNTYGYQRSTRFVPEAFFTTPYAHWGPKGKQPKSRKMDGVLCTMLIGVRLLHYLGARCIYLIGVDHHGRRRYRKEAAMLELLVPEFERVGLELYNCSPDTELELFPYCSFGDAVGDCKGSVSDEPLDTYGWYAKEKTQADCERLPKVVPVHY